MKRCNVNYFYKAQHQKCGQLIPWESTSALSFKPHCSWKWRSQALLLVFIYLSHPLAVQPCTSLSTPCDTEKL